MRKATFLLLVSCFLLGATGSAFATHKQGHQQPPACSNSQGNAPSQNRHCYPPPTGGRPSACDKPNPPPNNPHCSNASYTTEAPAERRPAVTVGMVLAAGALATVLLMVRRRWSGWLRRG